MSEEDFQKAKQLIAELAEKDPSELVQYLDTPDPERDTRDDFTQLLYIVDQP